jgi:L-rhamnose isomerase
MALLEPQGILREMELRQDFTGRLALLEEIKSMPFGPVWDYYCQKMDVPVGTGLIDEIKAYEKNTLARRS